MKSGTEENVFVVVNPHLTIFSIEFYRVEGKGRDSERETSM